MYDKYASFLGVCDASILSLSPSHLQLCFLPGDQTWFNKEKAAQSVPEKI